MVTFALVVLALDRDVAHADAYGRLGPTGAAVVTGVMHRHVGLREEAERLDASYVQTGVDVTVTPAYVAPGAYVEAAPAAFAILRLEVDAFGFLGLRGGQGLLRFPSSRSAFGDSALGALAGQERAASGGRFVASATLRAKVGPLVPRIDVAAAAYRFLDGGPWLYESEHDTLLGPRDGMIEGRVALLALAWRGTGDATLAVGPDVEAFRTLRGGLSRTRAGALAWWVPWDDPSRQLRRPHVFASAGLDLADPNRGGQPYATLGVGADWE